MADTRIIMLALSDLGATVDDGVNLTNAEVVAKTEAGNNQITARGGISCFRMCHDWSGNLYVADAYRHFIFKVSEGGGGLNGDYQVSTVAGKANTSGNNAALQNVLATDARFNTPSGIACDKSGTLYVADTANHQIRTIKDGLVSVLAGSGIASGAGGSGLVDGDCMDAKFSSPVDVAVDRSGVVYVSDMSNHAVRKISGGQVVTIAGNGVAGARENLVPTSDTNTWPSRLNVFNTTSCIVVDRNSNVYVYDYNNRKIKMITPNGSVYLHSGSGANGRTLGTPYTSSYCTIVDMDIDDSNNLYVLDQNAPLGSRLLKLDSDGTPGVVAEFAGATSYNTYVRSVCCSPGQKIFVGTYDGRQQ